MASFAFQVAHPISEGVTRNDWRERGRLPIYFFSGASVFGFGAAAGAGFGFQNAGSAWISSSGGQLSSGRIRSISHLLAATVS